MTAYRSLTPSDQCRRLKGQALQRAGGQCEGQREADWSAHPEEKFRCESTGPFQLHHLYYGTPGEETLDQVLLLCDECHRIETVKSWFCSFCQVDTVFACDSDALDF